MAITQQHHDDKRHAHRQPESLAYLMGDLVSPPGAVELNDNRHQRQQQAVTEQNDRQPDGGAHRYRDHISSAYRAGHNGITTPIAVCDTWVKITGMAKASRVRASLT